MAKCEYLGHMWKATMSPGWFRCERAIEIRNVKQQRRTTQLVYCGAVGYCPFCLGYCLGPVYHVVPCSEHARLDLSMVAVR